MIIITGASDGLGLELAKLFTEDGKIVANVSRRKCSYAQRNYLTDLSDLEDVKTIAEKITKTPEKIWERCFQE